MQPFKSRRIWSSAAFVFLVCISAIVQVCTGSYAKTVTLKAKREVAAVYKTKLLHDVKYGESSGVSLLMNITLPDPAPKKPVPVVVFYHGGGWSGGTREDMMSRCPLVTQLGYVGASVEYRLSAVAPFPAQIQDCKCAVRYLRANAAKYGIDPDRIAVWGCSAGGHLAAMMGLTEGVGEFEGDGGYPNASSRVQMVIDCFGPTDFILWQNQINKYANDADAREVFSPPADNLMYQWWLNFSLEKDPGIVKLFEGKARERSAWASPLTYADQKQSVESVSKAEKWQDQEYYRKNLNTPGSRRALLDIQTAESWKSSEQSTTGLELTIQNGGVTGKYLEYKAQSVSGWGVFIKDIPKGTFKVNNDTLALWAKCDQNTPEILLELDEQDGSRWTYSLRVSTDWKYYEIPFNSFKWLAGPPNRHTTSEDKFDVKSAAKVSIGLAKQLCLLNEGPHQIMVDGISGVKSSVPKLPAFLIVHGTQDTWVPLQQSTMLADKLDKVGTDVTLLLEPNMGHDDSKAWPKILEYIKQRFPVN